MEMTHKQIMNQPNAKVSRLLALLKLDSIRSNARSKAEVIGQSESSRDDGMEALYKRWFEDIADQVNRAMDDLNESSEETQY